MKIAWREDSGWGCTFGARGKNCIFDFRFSERAKTGAERLRGAKSEDETHCVVGRALLYSTCTCTRVTELACIWLGELLRKWSWLVAVYSAGAAVYWRSCTSRTQCIVFTDSVSVTVRVLCCWLVTTQFVLLFISTARYSEFILAHSLCLALTAVLLFSTAYAHTRAPQVYTYPSHSYINSYHSALMLQFSVFQNHLNPDLLSAGLWMVEHNMRNLCHS